MNEEKHIHEFSIIEKTVPATCTNNGFIITKCACGELHADPVPVLGHDYRLTDEIKPSCTRDGYVEYTCTRCGNVRKEELNRLGHDFQIISTVDSDCMNPGFIEYRCTRCGEIIKEEIPLKPGHKYDEIVIEPTCISQGYTKYVCSVCGNSYIDINSYKDPIGHDYQLNRFRSVAPTCTEDGKEVYSCTRCESTKELKVAKLGHIYNKVNTTKPTIIHDGYTEYRCDRCGIVKQDDFTKYQTPEISNIRWDNGIARWDYPINEFKFRVELYANGELIKTIITPDCYYDFNVLMDETTNDNCVFTFKVQAFYQNSSKLVESNKKESLTYVYYSDKLVQNVSAPTWAKFDNEFLVCQPCPDAEKYKFVLYRNSINFATLYSKSNTVNASYLLVKDGSYKFEASCIIEDVESAPARSNVFNMNKTLGNSYSEDTFFKKEKKDFSDIKFGHISLGDPEDHKEVEVPKEDKLVKKRLDVDFLPVREEPVRISNPRNNAPLLSQLVEEEMSIRGEKKVIERTNLTTEKVFGYTGEEIEFKFTLTDKLNNPIPNKTLIVKYSDGTTKELLTDNDGTIRTKFLFNYGGQYTVTCTFTGDDDYDACSIENRVNIIDEKESNAIKVIRIEFTEPKDGMTSNRPLITISGNCTIDENNTYWTYNKLIYRDLFKDGDDYELKYSIHPNAGYHFADRVKLIVNGTDYGDVYSDKDSNINGYTKPFHVETDEIIDDEQEFTATFITYEGVYKEFKVKANEYLEKPTDPTMEGFDFVGWYVDNGFTHEYKFVDRVKHDIYLYAKFKEKEEFVRKNGGSKTIFHISKEGDFGEMTNTIDSDKSLAETDIDTEINKWKSLDKYDVEIKYGDVKVINTVQVQHIYIKLKEKQVEVIESLDEPEEEEDIDIFKTIEFDPEGTDFKRIAKTLTLSL